jgi:hypothetical protein
MSERPDWTECLYRPSMLCGEKDEKIEYRRGAGTVDMREIWRMMEAQPPPQPHNEPPQTEETPPAEAIPTQPPPSPEPTPPQAVEIPVRHKGLLFSSFWQIVNEP